MACASGYWSLKGDQVCQPCPAGSRCSSTTSPPVLCPAGTYSPAASTSCEDCPQGFACADPASPPVACGGGFFSPKGDHVCTTCPAGSECPPGSASADPCAAGTWSLPGAAACTVCLAGEACSPTRDAPPTYCACDVALTRLVLLCVVGRFFLFSCCPTLTLIYTASRLLLSCGRRNWLHVGRWRPVMHTLPCRLAMPQYVTTLVGWIFLRCAHVPFRLRFFYSTDSGEAAEPCPTGQYSLGGATKCTVCPAGHQCGDAAVPPVPCDLGTYSTAQSTTCTPCSAGFRCPVVDQVLSYPCECVLFPCVCPITCELKQANAAVRSAPPPFPLQTRHILPGRRL